MVVVDAGGALNTAIIGATAENSGVGAAFEALSRLRERSLRREGWYEDHVVMSVTRPEYEIARAAFSVGAE